MLCCCHRFCPALALCTFFLITTTAQASYVYIAGYEPGSDVTQHSFIDLDQQEMETHLKKEPPDFDAARKIYTLGGNSGAYAQFTVSPLAAGVAKGATVKQTGNAEATGYLQSSASAGATTVKVTYTSKCKMGGTSSPDANGCFAASGNLNVSGADVGSSSGLTNKYRTLAGFSTAARAKMGPHQFYTAYRAYYNEGDYAHQFVMGALNGTGIFTGKDAISRVECAQKGSAYQNVWMYVIRKMEEAVMDCDNGCLNCNDDPVHAWDEMVAFYAGSLTGAHGSSSGNLLYSLAEKRCANFGTCTGVGGESAVNEDVIAQSRIGQLALIQGRCVDVIHIKRRIVELMSVPLVQGALRYAYKVDRLNGSSKEIAEGAAFSAAILPRVAECNTDAAKLISDNMVINALSPMQSGFVSVKEAFESTYACMGITCEDVGGLILSENEYFPVAGPCVSTMVGVVRTKEVEETPLWTIVVMSAASVSLLAMCMVAWIFRKQAQKYKLMAEGKPTG